MYRDRTHLQVLELQGVQKGLLVGRVKTLLQHKEWFFLLNNRNATEEVGEGGGGDWKIKGVKINNATGKLAE